VFGSFGTIVSLAILTGQLVASLAGGTTGPIPLMTGGGILTMITGVIAFAMLARLLGGRTTASQSDLKLEEGSR
jgi:hypothetical protein